ncbi:Y-family DNA polymerase [Hymenobacter chitinivorans]|uniref:DNA polymerase V n=1 Tax=Hymenobacter chitinivorans DSM 11115 TaxID=1121954 RepID=A0A2M9BAI2_9BACT|nr:Y-family DNA polymerase [Hymenobacter chitinivorans]PJJ54960.1 DNA polymerase V [Hymenobacter chitinivorans DSM 11115]
MFGLVDCNNFYVSCERVFQPRLDGQPVVVLSNNDGCIISRSTEAKALGLQMGDPYFQVKPVLEQHQVTVLSSNYALYGDMSRRVMWYLSQVTPEVEIYSIDEAFLDLHGMERFFVQSLDTFARTLRANVLARTGIPTCVGVAPTKTLAKLANRLAKKSPAMGGVCYLDTDERRRWALEQVAVEDIWGIGRQYATKLYSMGITTAADLAGCSEALARKHLGGVVGARLVRELQGFPCQGLAPSEDGTLSRRTLCCSRTFGKPLSDFPDLLGAISAFASRAAEKLRRQGDAAHYMTVFLSKSRYGMEPPPYSCSVVLTLPVATNDTLELLRYARVALKRLWQADSRYTKAGVVLDGLEPAGQTQLTLFEAGPVSEKRIRLMAELDALNRRFGNGTVRLATSMLGRGEQRAPWEGQAQWRTPAYTTRLEDLLLVG